MKSRQTVNSVFLLIVSLFFLFVGVVYAELDNVDLPDREGVKILNKSKLHAAFKADEMIDTNIYLQNTDRFIDSITILSPSLGVDIPLHNANISADYQADIYEYGVHHTEDHTDQTLRGLAELYLSEYKVVVNEVMKIFTDRAANEDSLRLRQQTNNIRAGVSREFNRLILDVGYTNRLETYQSDDAFYQTLTYRDKDRDMNIIDTTVSYRFWPKTVALLENNLGFIRYYNSSEVPGSYFDEALFGFKGEWFSRANINFRAGFRFQQYDKSDMLNDKSYIGAVMKGGFDYSPTDNDIVIFEFDREIYESTYNNMNYYVSNLIGFNWRHNFTRKVSANVSGSYQLHLYPSVSTENNETAKRYDNYYLASVGLRYDLRKWVSLEAKYEYVNRISRFDIFDYVDNVVSASCTVGF